MMKRSAVLAGVAALAACARIPVDQAEAQCARTARYGGGANTSVLIGIGGSVGGTGIGVSTALPQYSDPAAAYTACVYRKSGQAPQTKFADRPEVKE